MAAKDAADGERRRVRLRPSRPRNEHLRARARDRAPQNNSPHAAPASARARARNILLLLLRFLCVWGFFIPFVTATYPGYTDGQYRKRARDRLCVILFSIRYEVRAAVAATDSFLRTEQAGSLPFCAIRFVTPYVGPLPPRETLYIVFADRPEHVRAGFARASARLQIGFM